MKALEQQGQQPGPQGEQGSPGEEATKLFAYIRDGGGSTDGAAVHYGSGVTGVEDNAGFNLYRVTFNRSLVNCVVHAIPGFGDPATETDASVRSFPRADIAAGGANQVDVEFFDPEGTATDTSFMITAFC